MTKVAVPCISFSQNPTLRAELLASYPDAKFNDAKRRFIEDELIGWLRGYDAAIMGLEPVTEKVLSALPELKVIARFGVGLDTCDPVALKRHGVRIGWEAGVNKISVAELAIAFAINGLRHVGATNAEMRAGLRPMQRMGRHLSGRVVGLHGCGNVGKEVVRLLKSFQCEILVCDIADYREFYRANGVTAVSFDELLRRSEVLSLHLPLNRSTRGLYGAAALDKLRPDCVFINTCRGGIVDEAALKERLKAGKIAAACFDVFAIEPPTDDEMLRLPNFLATPHIGGSAEEARLTMGRAAIRGLTQNFVPEPGVYPFD